MGPVVVVMLPPEVTARDADVVVASCTAALRAGQCVLGGDAHDDASTVATATAMPTGADGVHLDVEVRASETSPARHPARDLRFQDADPVVERWKSVGFVIAGLSGAGAEPPPDEPEETPPPTPPEPPRPGPVAVATPLPPPPPSAPPGTGRGALRVLARFDVGPGLSRGPWRVGGGAGAGYDFHGAWGVDVLATYATGLRDVSGVAVSWLTLAAGATVTRSALGVEGRLGVMLGARDVHAAESGASGEEARTRWLPMALGQASLSWPAASLLAIRSGLEVRGFSGGTAVRSHGAYIGASPSAEFGLFFALEARP